MPTPSLLIVPARFKTGKLYSQIPTSGAGDFTVTRNTAARRFNSAGLIESVASGIPRLDYYTSGGVTGCPALLVEPAATNLALQSADFNTTWQSINSATVNTNTAISPDGTQNADTINLAAVNASRVRQAITLANSTTYTISCFYKNIALTAGETFRMRFDNTLSAPNNFVAAALIDLAAGTATYSLTGTSGTGFSGTATGRIENYGNGWYRVSLTFTVGSAGGALSSFEVGYISPAAVRSFYAWGAQLETGSVSTSYIPTTTGTGSRSADAISVSGAVSGSIGQQSGTLYIECQSEFATNDIIFINTAGQSIGNNYLAITKNNQNRFQATVFAAGTTTISFTETSGITSFAKIAIAYASGNTACYINGLQISSTSATGFTFNGALSQIRFATDLLAGKRPARIRAVALYTTRLTNAELAALTAP